MITFIFKFLIVFVISFFILNIPIGTKKLFTHLNYYAQPLTAKFSKSINGTKELGKQLFINSNPRHTLYDDSITKKQSAILKNRKKHIHNTAEEISENDQANLINVIESHSRE